MISLLVSVLVGSACLVLGYLVGEAKAYAQSERQLASKPEPKALPEGPNDILVVNLATGEETELPALPSLPSPRKKGDLLPAQLKCPRCSSYRAKVLMRHGWCNCYKDSANTHAHGYCPECESEWLEEVPNNYAS